MKGAAVLLFAGALVVGCCAQGQVPGAILNGLCPGCLDNAEQAMHTGMHVVDQAWVDNFGHKSPQPGGGAGSWGGAYRARADTVQKARKTHHA